MISFLILKPSHFISLYDETLKALPETPPKQCMQVECYKFIRKRI
jgi:hypothetical protein